MARGESERNIKRLTFYGEVSDMSVGDMVHQINKCNEDADTSLIQLYICTSGGGIYAGIGLYDVIRLSKLPIETVAFGHCESMGVTILQAGVRRYATKNARLMIHPCFAGGSASGSRIPEANVASKELSRNEAANHKLVSTRVGMTPEQYKRLMGDRKYLSASEAKRLNFIDGIKTEY